MGKKVIKMFIAVVMVFAIAMTLSPQTANAEDCKTYNYGNVAESEWQCIKNYVESKGYSLSGESGEVSQLNCGLKYNYSQGVKDLNFTTKSGFLCPVSCSTIDSAIGGYVNEALQQCRERSQIHLHNQRDEVQG